MRPGLFYKLLDIIEAAEVRALYQYYENSLCYLEVNGNKSEIFKVTIGVKQGWPLSLIANNSICYSGK